jgi:hypothetical protein
MRIIHGGLIGGKAIPGYYCWLSMRRRCDTPKHKSFHNYGGRGIRVCERWSSFAAFIADMGPRPSSNHSIERRDNNGNYEPGNCHWATPIEQLNNSRTNRWITLNGESHTVCQWSRILGIKHVSIFSRIHRGITDPARLLAPTVTKKERRASPETKLKQSIVRTAWWASRRGDIR